MRRLSLIILCMSLLGGCVEPTEFATGYASNASPRDAARAAFAQATAGLGEKPLKGVVFAVYYPPAGFSPATPEAYRIDATAEAVAAEEIAALCKTRGAVPNIGVRGRGITREGVHLGRGISVLAIFGGGETKAALVPIKPDRKATASELVEVLRPMANLQAVFAFGEMSLQFEPGADRAGFASTLTRGLSSRAMVFLAGGMNDPAATSDPLGSVQFYNGEAYTGGLAVMAIASPGMRLFSTTRHEFIPADPAGVLTKVQRGWAVRIDGKPALAVYRQRRGMAAEERLVPDSKYPIAINVGSRRYVTMVVDWVGRNGNDSHGQKSILPPGSMRFRQRVEEGSVIDILTGGDDATSIASSAAAAARRSVDTALNGNAKPSLLWVGECHQRVSRWCHSAGFFGGVNPAEESIALQSLRQTIDSRLAMDNRNAPRLPIFGIVGMGNFAPFGAEYKGADHVFQQNVVTATVLANQP